MSTSGPRQAQHGRGTRTLVCCCTGRCWSWQMNKCWRKSWNYKWAEMEAAAADVSWGKVFVALTERSGEVKKLSLISLAAFDPDRSILFAKTRRKLPIKLNEKFDSISWLYWARNNRVSSVVRKSKTSLRSNYLRDVENVRRRLTAFILFSRYSRTNQLVVIAARHPIFHIFGNFYRALSDDAQWSESDSSCIICQNMVEFNKKSRNVRDKRLSNLFPGASS